MTYMTQAQADRIHARTAQIVARMRCEADAAEASGNYEGAAALRTIADSRERSTANARAGAVIGRA